MQIGKVNYINLFIFLIIIAIVCVELIALKKIIDDNKMMKKHHLENKGSSLINYLWPFPILLIVRILGNVAGVSKYLFGKR